MPCMTIQPSYEESYKNMTQIITQQFFSSARNPETRQMMAFKAALSKAGCGLLGRGHKRQFRLTSDFTKTTRNPV